MHLARACLYEGKRYTLLPDLSYMEGSVGMYYNNKTKSFFPYLDCSLFPCIVSILYRFIKACLGKKKQSYTARVRRHLRRGSVCRFIFFYCGIILCVYHNLEGTSLIYFYITLKYMISCKGLNSLKIHLYQS